MKIRELRHNLWNIGFYEDGLESLLTVKTPNIHWVKKKFKDRWFADPFILEVNDSEIIILAEEFCYEVKRGRIARVVIDRHTYEEKNYSIIFDLPTHLSFPFIYRKGEKVYVMPENSASGCSTIYEYDDTTLAMSRIGEVSNEPFTDAIIVEIDGNYHLWTTMQPYPNGKTLAIYGFDQDKLCATCRQTEVSFLRNTARNAGECFKVAGKIYRPAQDCTEHYGQGVIIQECIRKNGDLQFLDINSFYPSSFKYNHGIHTLNHYKGVTVFDTCGYRYPVIGRIAKFLISIINRG